MANIYITDEAQNLLDKTLKEYNNNNATTDRSGMIEFLIDFYKEYRKQ